MLNQMEAALLRARGYSEPIITPLQRDAVATAFKTTERGVVQASALGRSPEDAARKLVALVTRP